MKRIFPLYENNDDLHVKYDPNDPVTAADLA